MPAKDVQTNLQIALSTKGFDQGLRSILGVTQKSLEGMKQQALGYGKVQKEIDKMQATVQDLAKIQLDASQQLGGISDKNSDAWKKETRRLKDAAEQSARLKKEVVLLAAAHRSDATATEHLVRAQQKLVTIKTKGAQAEERQQRWAGMQGVVQGAGMGGMAGKFMQRGPGFWRQFAGQQAGGMLRRAGGAVGSLATGGVGGFQQALGAIPVVGGAMAGQLGAAAGHADQALQWQREQVQLAPMFQPAEGEMGKARQAQQQAAAIRKNMRGNRRRQNAAYKTARDQAAESLDIGGIGGMLGMSPADREEYLTSVGLAAKQKLKQADVARDGTQKELSRKAARLSRQAEKTPYGRAGKLGGRYLGLGRQESAQQVGQLYQVAGGKFAGEKDQRRAVGTSMAAQTMYGVQAQTAGAFLGAGRRGGLIGGRGQAAESLTGALGDAVAIGLEGSEITQYMQQVAQGIMQFQQTGIPMNKNSLKAMALEINKAGIGGVRGAAMAGGLQQYVQGIGQRGITGGMDLMLMQAFGGFKGDGSPGDYRNAIIRMEAMQGMEVGAVGAESPLSAMVKREFYRAGGKAGEGDIMVRRMLGKVGMRGSQAEFTAMIERATGETILAPEQRKGAFIDVAGETGRRKKGAAQAQQTPEQLMAAAAERITSLGPNLRTQARLMDKQLAIGEGILTTVQNLKDSSLTLNAAFVKLAGPSLTAFSSSIKDVTSQFVKWTEGEGLLGKIKDTALNMVLPATKLVTG